MTERRQLQEAPRSPSLLLLREAPLERSRQDLPRVWLMTAGHFAIDSYPAVLFALIPVFIARFSLSYAQAGLLSATMLSIGAIGQVPFGYLHDRFPGIPTSAAGLVLTALSISAIGFFSAYPVLLALSFCAGLGSAAFHPQAVAQSVAASTSRLQLGISIFFTGGAAGAAVMSLAIVPLVTTWGLRATALLPLPGLLVAALFVRAYRNWFFQRRPQAQDQVDRRVAPPVAPLSLLFTISVLRSAVMAAFTSFIPALVVLEGGSLRMGGVGLAIFIMSGSAAALVGSAAATRLGSKGVVLLSLVFATAGLLVIPWLRGPALFAALPFVGVFLFASEAQVISLVQRLMSGATALASSLMMGLGVGLGNIGAVAAGKLADSVGLPLALTMVSALLVGAVAAAIALYPALRRSQRLSAVPSDSIL